MENATTLDVTPKTDAEYEAAVNQYLSEIDRMKGRMDEDQREIEALRAETDAVLKDIMRTCGTSRRSVGDVLADAPGHLAFQNANGVDAHVRAEREAWDH